MVAVSKGWSGEVKGVWPALVTPFTEDGSSIDYASVDRLLEYQLSAGVDGLVVVGSTGEAATLSDVEYGAIIRYVVERVEGKVPCIAGVNASGTARAIELAGRAIDSGAQNILLVTPPYNKPTQEGIVKHFEAVRAAVGIPLIGYNIPGRTAVGMTTATVAELTSSQTISGLKDASGSLDVVLDFLVAAPKLQMLAGDDSYVLALLAHGGVGAISASANIAPKAFKKITTNAFEGRWDIARAAQLEILPLIRLMFRETNPIPVKAALCLKGIIKHATTRLPLTKASAGTEEALKELFGTKVIE